MAHQAPSCREAFRLHAMDLLSSERPAPSQPHWMLRDESLMNWLASLQKEYWLLALAGGDPLDGEPIEPETMIRRLGFADRKAPSGLLDCARFTASMLVATTREAVRVRSEVSRLRRARRAAGSSR